MTRGKRQEVSIRGQCRSDVQSPQGNHRPSLARRQLDHVDVLRIAIAIGGEDEEPAVRRPLRHEIQESIGGELARIIAIIIHHEQLAGSPLLSHIRNLRPRDARLARVTKYQFVGKAVRHQPHNRGRSRVALPPHDFIAAAVIDEAFHVHIGVFVRLFQARFSPDQDRDTLLSRLFEYRLGTGPHPIADIGCLNPETGQVQQIKDQGAFHILFEDFFDPPSQPVGASRVVYPRDAQGNLLEVGTSGFEEHICRPRFENADKPRYQQHSTETGTDQFDLRHPANSPTRNTISTSL